MVLLLLRLLLVLQQAQPLVVHGDSSCINREWCRLRLLLLPQSVPRAARLPSQPPLPSTPAAAATAALLSMME
jgi:hypothetical protein